MHMPARLLINHQMTVMAPDMQETVAFGIIEQSFFFHPTLPFYLYPRPVTFFIQGLYLPIRFVSDERQDLVHMKVDQEFCPFPVHE